MENGQETFEIWRDIAGFPGYQVSSFGRLRTIDRKFWNKANNAFSNSKGRLLKLDLVNKKYAQIGMYIDGKHYKRLVHRLVALAFVENPDLLPEVNHKDTDKKNNNYLNLEWCTRLQNAQHAKANGKYSNFSGKNRSNTKLTIEAVVHIRKKNLTNKEYSELYGVSHSCICLVQSDKHKGVWKNAY